VQGEAGVRLTGGAGREKSPQKQSSSFQIQKLLVPELQNFPNFYWKKIAYQEHNAKTNTQKAIKDCSQKFKKIHSFPIFQEFYGSG
jgi:hypothetical protein